MASTYDPEVENGSFDAKEKLEEQENSGKAAPPRKTVNYYVVAEVVLRVSLYLCTLVSVVVMVTGKQTVAVFGIPVTAKFTYSPAFIYLIAACSVACLYSIISTLLSLLTFFKKDGGKQWVCQVIILTDVVMLGIVSSACGAASAIGYVGIKGNSYVYWNEICNTYDTYCLHIGISVLFSLIASVVLLLLVSLSVCTLLRKIPN